MAAFAWVVFGACSSVGVDQQGPSTPVTLGAATASAEDSSALDGFGIGRFDSSERSLVGLLVAAEAIGAGLRLVDVSVDDPNGNGRIDGRWYPPRVRRTDCRIEVDTAPAPLSAATFVPGEGWLVARSELLDVITDAEFTLSVQIVVFDEASQRDEFAAVMVEFYDQMATFDCADMDLDVEIGSVSGSLIGERRAVEPYETGYEAYALETDTLVSSNYTSQYAVGDTVLLVVALSGRFFDPEEPGEPLSKEIAHRAIDAQITRLETLGYG